MGQRRRLLASSDMPPEINHDIDMRDMSWHRAIIEAFQTLLGAHTDVMRVVGPAPMGEFVEIVANEAPLRSAMVEFSIRILILSLIISGFSATLVFVSLHRLLVRPMRRMTENMVAFRADPENPARIIAASDRRDEIGTAERELGAMQGDLAPCSHRRIISPRSGLRCPRSIMTAQPLDLGAALLRAAGQCRRSARPALCAAAHARARARDRVLPIDVVLRPHAGAAARAPHDRARARGGGYARGIGARCGLSGALDQRSGARLTVDADPEQLFRILLNLARNALQALESRDSRIPAAIRSALPGGARAPWW